MAKRKDSTISNLIPLDITAATGSVVTRKMGNMMETKITVAEFTQAVTNAALAFGKKVGSFPKGKIIVHKVDVELTYKSSNTQTNTPEFGIGTGIASGVYATLGEVNDIAEDIIDGTALTAFDGTTVVSHKQTYNGELDQKDGSVTAKDIYINFADTFTAVRTLSISGVITILWSNLQD